MIQQLKDSDNDPIDVNFFPTEVVNLKGQIGITLAPGKKNFGMHLNWNRDLNKDLLRLRIDYQTDILVTLVEKHELEDIQISDLQMVAEAQGIKSIWFPIKDRSIPQSIDTFIKLISDILEAVKTGETVVIHCKAGLGRTGMVTACCLVALGYFPTEAITIVRQTRQYTIETTVQEKFISQFAQILSGDRLLSQIH
ncbi:MAG: cyclin-dependent kinase inhibitor 3 family protein [Microcoleaceae cyanobacterium MO_207.B10]|nr:cyclin-dependent kinase inhibitor 3 family protein [Microcoleaceae cyanobacterium MO_207.B10]